MVSLFLIIGQISASDTDLMEINDSNTSCDSMELSNPNTDSHNLDLMDYQTIGDNDNSNKLSEDSNPENLYEDNDSIETIEQKEKNTTGIVMSNDSFSCGPASLATVLNKNGLNLSLNEVSHHTNTSLNGTTMQSLIDASGYYNFTAIGVEMECQNLKENYIVHLDICGSKHWTVISKVTDTHVFLADSSAGNINLTIEEFNSYFTKKAIVLFKNTIDLKEQTISNQMNVLDKNQCLSISGKGLKKKVVGYKTVWKYGWIQKYGWVLRPVVKGGHVSFSQWQYVKGYYSVWGKYKTKEPIYKYYFVNDEALTSAKIKKSKK